MQCIIYRNVSTMFRRESKQQVSGVMGPREGKGLATVLMRKPGTRGATCHAENNDSFK